MAGCDTTHGLWAKAIDLWLRVSWLYFLFISAWSLPTQLIRGKLRTAFTVLMLPPSLSRFLNYSLCISINCDDKIDSMVYMFFQWKLNVITFGAFQKLCMAWLSQTEEKCILSRWLLILKCQPCLFPFPHKSPLSFQYVTFSLIFFLLPCL